MNFSSIAITRYEKIRSQDMKYVTKVLLNSQSFVIEVTFFHTIIFPKSVLTPSKIRTAISFYAKALKRFSEKFFSGFRGFRFHWLTFLSRNFGNN